MAGDDPSHANVRDTFMQRAHATNTHKQECFPACRNTSRSWHPVYASLVQMQMDTTLAQQSSNHTSQPTSYHSTLALLESSVEHDNWKHHFKASRTEEKAYGKRSA